MGPEQGDRRPAVQAVLSDPRGCGPRARVSGQRHRGLDGLPQYGLETGNFALLFFLKRFLIPDFLELLSFIYF